MRFSLIFFSTLLGCQPALQATTPHLPQPGDAPNRAARTTVAPTSATPASATLITAGAFELSQPQPTRQAASSSDTTLGPAEAATETDEAQKTQASWAPLRSALLAADWAHAETLASARLSDSVELSPLQRYLLARIALETQQYDLALLRLQNVPDGLPGFKKTLARRHEQALAGSAAYLTVDEPSRVRDIERLLAIIKQQLANGDHKSADKALKWAAVLRVPTRLQPQFRELRSRWAMHNSRPYRAYFDWHWLALHAPTSAEAQRAELELQQHFAHQPLTRTERLARLKTFRQGGALGLVEKELKSLAELRGPKIPRGLSLHWRGLAAYTARDFPVAAELFSEALKHKSARSEKDRYYAARALSRSGRLTEAATLFASLSRQLPKRSMTGAAHYRLAQQFSWLGQWKKASDTFSTQLKRYPGSSYNYSAKRQRATALFAQGRAQAAANAWLSLQKEHPTKSETRLHQLLEALAHEQAGHPAHARLLLQNLAARAPLSFATRMARLRLELPAAAPPSAAPPGAASESSEELQASLPPAVSELESYGLIDEAAALMQGQRSRWWSAHGANKARAECEATKGLTHGRQRFIVGLSVAQRRGFFGNPGQSKRWLWECVYPAPYGEWVSSAAKEFRVPKSLIYAVMRQESGFRPKVHSPANARGLMQIIPPTGAQIAQELGLPYDNRLLEDPRINIRFGTYYLSQLLKQFDHHPAPVAAAYNAGPNAASRWLSGSWQLPLEVFISQIPYTETRNYVQRVVSNMLTYQALYPTPTDIPLALRFKEHHPLQPGLQAELLAQRSE